MQTNASNTLVIENPIDQEIAENIAAIDALEAERAALNKKLGALYKHSAELRKRRFEVYGPTICPECKQEEDLSGCTNPQCDCFTPF